MNWIKLTSKYVLAIFMIVAGTMHFINGGFFMKIMPPSPQREDVLLKVQVTTRSPLGAVAHDTGGILIDQDY
jgi:uncharacterized membrane protein